MGTFIAIGADGRPIIAYKAQLCDAYGSCAGGELRVTHCDDAACSSATTATLDSLGNVNLANCAASIAIGTDGLAVISYYDATNQDLKVAHCDNAACSSAALATVDDSAGDMGRYNAITIGADGLPVVSYYDATNQDLKVAHCGDRACQSAVLTTVDSEGATGSSTSITIGTDGLPVISYVLNDSYDGDRLKVAHCSNAFCTPYVRPR